MTADALTVRFWGVRGSCPMPGRSYLRYGGNTPCVEIRLGDRLFIIDAGTGFTQAGEALLDQAPACVDLLFSHLHHDHVSAFPFFAPALRGRCRIRTYCGHLGGLSAEHGLRTMFSPPLFPVSLDALPASIDHFGFRAGEPLDFDGIAVPTCSLFHPGGATGYRFDHGGRSVCYISDLEHTDPWPSSYLVRFCQDADLIIYDAMYTATEHARHKGWGHSTWNAGLALCRAAGAAALAAFHHHPLHDDAALDVMDAELKAASPASFVAREGQVVVLEARPALDRVAGL